MDDLGDRIKKNYENRYRFKLTRRVPVIMRLDGRAFHILTRTCEKPFDSRFADVMNYTAIQLCKEIQGAKCAYIQSDEISILLTDYDKLTTEAWFDYNIQKMTSISAGLASTIFSDIFIDEPPKHVEFDCRVFNIPMDEVPNYFIWRQRDWIRNSLQMYARAHFSHGQLQNKNSEDMHEMLHTLGLNWTNLTEKWKNGTMISKMYEDHDSMYDWKLTYGKFTYESLKEYIAYLLEANKEKE